MTTFLIILFGALFIWWAARYKPESKRSHVAETKPQVHAPIDQSAPIDLSGLQLTVTVTPAGAEQNAQPIDKDAWDDDYLNDYAAGAKRRKLDSVELCIYFVDRNGVATARDAMAAQRAAIASRAVATPPATVPGLDLTGQPAWVVENVRKLRAGLPVGHMARVRTAEMLGVRRAQLEAMASVVQ